MNLADLRSKTEEELKVLTASLKKDMQKVSEDLIKGKEKNIKKVKYLKKDFARIQTVLNEKKFLKESK